MTITEKFFVECVKKGIKNEKIDAIPEGLDYKQFHNLYVEHSMSVIVFNALENVLDKFPAQFIAAIKRSVNRHVMFDVQSEHDISTLLQAFEERKIKHMPLKGYHLKKLYPSTDMRYASDCDILIDVDQLNEIRNLVEELGLATKRHDEHHDIVYFPATRTIFELHKTIFVGALEEYFGVNNKGFDRARLKDGCKYFYEMDCELFYISILAHSAYHFAESAGVGIRHLTDIYLYRKAYTLDVEYLNRELEKCGLLKFKNEFEKVAAYFFDDDKADDFTKKLGEHILESSLLENQEKRAASEVAANMGDEQYKKAQRKTIWRKIFLSTEQMKFSYPILKKAIWLLPIFHVVRWVKILFTRPKAIGKLKGYHEVGENDLIQMKDLRDGLGINNL